MRRVRSRKSKVARGVEDGSEPAAPRYTAMLVGDSTARTEVESGKGNVSSVGTSNCSGA